MYVGNVQDQINLKINCSLFCEKAAINNISLFWKEFESQIYPVVILSIKPRNRSNWDDLTLKCPDILFNPSKKTTFLGILVDQSGIGIKKLFQNYIFIFWKVFYQRHMVWSVFFFVFANVCVRVCVFVCDLTSETSTQRPHLSHPTSPANAVVRKTSLLLLFLWRLEQLWSFNRTFFVQTFW